MFSGNPWGSRREKCPCFRWSGCKNYGFWSFPKVVRVAGIHEKESGLNAAVKQVVQNQIYSEITHHRPRCPGDG